MHDFRVAAAGKFEKVAIDPNCCIESVENGQTKCCKSSQAKSGQMVESKLSQVLLGVVADKSGRQQKATRYYCSKTDFSMRLFWFMDYVRLEVLLSTYEVKKIIFTFNFKLIRRKWILFYPHVGKELEC